MSVFFPGLKATESELEKFKCPKCDFQAYYQRQYQEHLQTHAEGLHKCKCCNFLAIDKESLVAHFKASPVVENFDGCSIYVLVPESPLLKINEVLNRIVSVGYK